MPPSHSSLGYTPRNAGEPEAETCWRIVRPRSLLLPSLCNGRILRSTPLDPPASSGRGVYLLSVYLQIFQPEHQSLTVRGRVQRVEQLISQCSEMSDGV